MFANGGGDVTWKRAIVFAAVGLVAGVVVTLATGSAPLGVLALLVSDMLVAACLKPKDGPRTPPQNQP